MKKKSILFILFLIVLVGVFVVYSNFFRRKEYNFQTVKIERGEITKTISTTGTLKYIKSVSVYPKIGGIVENVYVDFNSKVKKGQLLATLNSSTYRIELKKTLQNIIQTSNSMVNYEKEYKDTLKLYEAGFKSDKELSLAKYNYENAEASYKTAVLEYENAKLSYEYCFITSPIDGIVVNKNIDIGTNVTTTTSLFTIASGLNELEIEALVDETEIGNVKIGLPVSFSVGAFPNKIFSGKIRQIRLNPQTIQNIVNYTVVIKVDEKEKNLLAGMTASIDIVIESKENILKVPSTALRFQPSKDMLPKGKPAIQHSRDDKKERKFDREVKIIWLYDKNTKDIKPLPVKTGLSDGKNVEIIPLKEENIEGLDVIIASTTKDKKQGTTTPSNPMMFGPQPPRR
ncbi:MAG: efflux RND transporter periplasmic adaptor subunit [Brevinematales bacterium]|nr:efflux RND transporter periplasmic adaptor subunit [Brevinematales bacterium]